MVHRRPDEVTERPGTDCLVAREGFRPGVDHALARHGSADDRGEHSEGAVRFDTTVRLEAARVIEHVCAWADLGCPRNQRRFCGAGRRTSRDNLRLESRGGKRVQNGVDLDTRGLGSLPRRARTANRRSPGNPSTPSRSRLPARATARRSGPRQRRSPRAFRFPSDHLRRRPNRPQPSRDASSPALAGAAASRLTSG